MPDRLTAIALTLAAVAALVSNATAREQIQGLLSLEAERMLEPPADIDAHEFQEPFSMPLLAPA